MLIENRHHASHVETYIGLVDDIGAIEVEKDRANSAQLQIERLPKRIDRVCGARHVTMSKTIGWKVNRHNTYLRRMNAEHFSLHSCQHGLV